MDNLKDKGASLTQTDSKIACGRVSTIMMFSEGTKICKFFCKDKSAEVLWETSIEFGNNEKKRFKITHNCSCLANS